MNQIQMRRFEDLIRENFPDFHIQSTQKLGEGWMSIAILVNEQWVFRFPKKQEGADDLEKEIKIMPKLAERITLAIPQFEFVGKQHNALPFVGYRLLPGEILGEDAVPSLPVSEQRMIARQIAKFIDEISSFPVSIARNLDVPEVDLRHDYVEMFEQMKQTIFPHFDQDMKNYISLRFRTYLDHSDNFGYRPALIHGDLSPDHYLIDPKERKLTGIIDFGDLQITDPDYEYIYILEDCGEDFARHVMEERGQDHIEDRLKKVSFFITADHLATILEGYNRKNQELIIEGIDAIRLEMG